MGSRLCESCAEHWPYRNRFVTCPVCGGQTLWSSHPAMLGERADRLAAGLDEFRADWAAAERASAHGFSVAEILIARAHGEEPA